MKLLLNREEIYRGALILVNARHGISRAEEAKLCGLSADDGVRMDRRAARALERLMRAIDGWREIAPVSGWRARAEQERIWRDALREGGEEFARKYAALPDHSEHQTGLAIDLGQRRDEIDFIRPDFPDVGACARFRARAAEFGFVERYPMGKEAITGIACEPWHFRYAGAPHAQIMAARGLCLEEYLDLLRDFPHGGAGLLSRFMGREVSLSFLRAEGATVALDAEGVCGISGNNVDGWIITSWRDVHEDDGKSRGAGSLSHGRRPAGDGDSYLAAGEH